MRYFLTTLFLSFILTACSHQNAFTKFNFTKEQELGVSSLKSSKIMNNNQIEGVFSAIYLNEIDSNSFNGDEYFYIYAYLKNSSDKITLTLNKKNAIKIEKLSNKNKFSNLSSINNDWNQYYLVTFAKEKRNTLNLRLKTLESSSTALVYKKEK